MSRTLTRNIRRTNTVIHCEEATGSRGQGCYSLVRFYDREGRTFRVTLHRDNYVEQSRAVAKVLTPAFTWTAVLDNPRRTGTAAPRSGTTGLPAWLRRPDSRPFSSWPTSWPARR